METVINYLDIPEAERMIVLRALLDTTNFWSKDSLETLKEKMDAAVRDQLPVYRFVFRGDTLIGYSFLYGETTANQIGGGAVNNMDELPLALDIRVLEEDIAIWEQQGCDRMANVFRMLLENHKRGLGRRPEEACR